MRALQQHEQRDRGRGGVAEGIYMPPEFASFRNAGSLLRS